MLKRKKIIFIAASIALVVIIVASLTVYAAYIMPVKKNDSRQPQQSARPQVSQTTPTPAPSSPPVAQPHNTTEQGSRGWHITTYYTVVEKYHHGSAEAVTGCLVRDCANGTAELGSYPSDFVEKVKNEGAGRISSGAYAGRYLNWAYDTGYWIDTIPSDTNGHILQAYTSAAADTKTLAQGTTFQLADCGTDALAAPQTVCDKLRSVTWRVVDHFTPGLGGPQHIDLYIGEENQDNFEATDQYVDLTNVSLRLL